MFDPNPKPKPNPNPNPKPNPNPNPNLEPNPNPILTLTLNEGKNGLKCLTKSGGLPTSSFSPAIWVESSGKL